MTNSQLAQLLIEKVADADIDKKIAVYVNRLLLRFHSQPAILANLADVTVFKPGFKGDTADQVEDGEFNESEAENEPVKEQTKATPKNDRAILQLSFRRLPNEVIAPLIRLIASPREPKLFHYTKDGSARLGVEVELHADDFPGDGYDYAF